MNATVIAIVIIAGFLALWAVTASRDKLLPRAMAVSVILFVIIPTYGPPRAISAIPIVISVVLLCLALIRQDTRRSHGSGVLLAMAFITFHAITQVFNDSILSLGLIAAQALAFCLSAVAASRLGAMDSGAIVKTIAILVPIQALVAALEQLRLIPYIWARNNSATYTDIAQRPNEILEWLPGRSMGTFAHPILLGSFAAVALVLCVVAAATTRRWSWLLLGCLAAGTLLLSGTRSAAAGALVALTLWLVLRRGNLLVLRLAVGIVLVVVALNLDQLTSSIFSTEVIASTSYVHRTRVLSSIPSILARDDVAVLFGSGAGSVEQLFADGVVTGASGFRFFDNQYIRLLALSGLVGLLLFIAAAFRGLRRGNEASRAVFVVILVMMASFDTLTWNFSAFLTAILLAGALPIGTKLTQSDAEPSTAQQIREPEADASREGENHGRRQGNGRTVRG